MTQYRFETGPAGTADNTKTEGSVSIGSGNTMTIDPAAFEGSFSLKIVHGDPVTPANPTAVSVVDWYSSGYPSPIGTTFTTGRYARGMICIKVPTGGFAAASGGYSTIEQFYGTSAQTATIARLRAVDKKSVSGLSSSGSTITEASNTLANGEPIKFTAIGAATNIVVGTTYYVVGRASGTFQVAATPGGTALVLGTATGLAYNRLQQVQFANNAATNVINLNTDLSTYEGAWVAWRWYIDTGTDATDAGGIWRFYGTNPYAATGSYDTEWKFGSLATTPVSFDLGSTGGVNSPVSRIRAGMITLQASPKTLWVDYVDAAGSASPTAGGVWVTPPSAPSTPVAVLGVSDPYPQDGASVTLTVSGSTGATTYALSLATPISGPYAGQPAYPVGTTAPSITNASTSTTTTITGLKTGQTHVKLHVTGPGGSSDVWAMISTHAANNTDTGVQDTTVVGYTVEGPGAPTAEGSQNDALDTTFLQGPATPTTGDYVLDMMQPFGAGGITISARYRQVNEVGDTTSGLTWFMQLYKNDGITLVDSWSWTSTAAASGVWAEQPCVVDDTNILAIPALSDRTALIVKRWAVIT